jgi:hypothetical protein
MPRKPKILPPKVWTREDVIDAANAAAPYHDPSFTMKNFQRALRVCRQKQALPTPVLQALGKHRTYTEGEAE